MFNVRHGWAPLLFWSSQLQGRLERPIRSQLRIRRGRSSDPGLLLGLFAYIEPCIDLIRIPNDAARG